MAKANNFISNKIEKILKEGVRRNTRKPVGPGNPRRKVSQRQAIAIAYSMAKKKGLKVGAKRSPKFTNRGKTIYG